MSTNGVDTSLLMTHETRIHDLESNVSQTQTATAVVSSRLNKIDSSLEKIGQDVATIAIQTAVLQAHSDWKQWLASNWWLLLIGIIGAGIPEILHHLLK